MAPRRKFWVSLVLFALLIGHGIDGLLGQEHWPFSNYPMYARVLPSDSLKSVRLFGVTADEKEFSFEKTAYLLPLGPKKANKTLVRLAAASDADGIRAALHDCAARYEARRKSGQLEGPALKSLRLYRLRWDVQPWAENRGEPARELIQEETL